MATASHSPVVFAYDGSDLAGLAIEEAGRQLAPGRQALVVCVWQPAEVGFVPVGEQHFDAADASQVKQAAEATAAQGGALAEQAGFQALSLAVEGSPPWQALIDTATEHGATLIVLGSHHRTGIAGRLLGSVTAAVVAHTTIPVLVVQQQA